jgi:uracil-DNA glycosylase family 4
MAGEECDVGGEMDVIGIAEARSALTWWLDAGVDVAVQEEPRNWLQPSNPVSRTQEPAPAPNVVEPSHETLAELTEWLASSTHLPLASATARRIMPHGPENPAIMLLSDGLTLEDSMAAQPIGGESWELAKRMLAAIRIPADQAYSASLSCFYTPGSRMTAEDREACAEIARRHIRLVKPKLLLLFGGGAAQALLGKPLPQARGHVHKVEGVRTVATFHPRDLINQPSNKSLAWKDLLLLTEEDS